MHCEEDKVKCSLYTELRALCGSPLKQVCALYFSDPDSKPATVDFDIIFLIN